MCLPLFIDVYICFFPSRLWQMYQFEYETWTSYCLICLPHLLCLFCFAQKNPIIFLYFKLFSKDLWTYLVWHIFSGVWYGTSFWLVLTPYGFSINMFCFKLETDTWRRSMTQNVIMITTNSLVIQPFLSQSQTILSSKSYHQMWCIVVVWALTLPPTDEGPSCVHAGYEMMSNNKQPAMRFQYV